jgi:hypothetical protein
VFYHRELVPGDVPWIGCSHIIPASPVVLFYYTSAWKFGKNIEQALSIPANSHFVKALENKKSFFAPYSPGI